jgi:predicted enzyme related to lactoylglutathione lyase
MAKRKVAKKRAKKSASRKPARKPMKKAANKKVARKKVAGKKVAKKRAAMRPARRAAAKAPAPKPPSRLNAITHTELASADPAATQAWCERVLGWSFMPVMPLPDGEYRMWRFEMGTGGGIRANNPPEVPGSIPYCEVADIRATYEAALAAGAMEMLSPVPLPGGMGWVAIVAAPGGVAFGFWGAG